MTLQEEKIPMWKEKEECLKKSSFDLAIGTLGTNKRFVGDKGKTEKKRKLGKVKVKLVASK
ncbi:MAG: hypothetical protein H3C31_00510 [Brumimicrobium sp.]|nr:hypothetical protein [Brumimicrobium sp.]